MTTPIHAYATEFVDVDLNATGTTTIYDPANDARAAAVYLPNGGGTADVQLEVTDGADTVVVADPAAGDPIKHEVDVMLGAGQSLQVNVTAAEGVALTETAGVERAEH